MRARSSFESRIPATVPLSRTPSRILPPSVLASATSSRAKEPDRFSLNSRVVPSPSWSRISRSDRFIAGRGVYPSLRALERGFYSSDQVPRKQEGKLLPIEPSVGTPVWWKERLPSSRSPAKARSRPEPNPPVLRYLGRPPQIWTEFEGQLRI